MEVSTLNPRCLEAVKYREHDAPRRTTGNMWALNRGAYHMMVLAQGVEP